MTCSRVRQLLGIAVLGGLSACAGPASYPLPYEVVAVDVSLSTGPRLADVRDDVHRTIAEAVAAGGGVGNRIDAVVFGGGPGDTRATSFVLTCRQRAQVCASQDSIDRLAATPDAAIDRLIGEGGGVSGSDPFGYLFRALGALATRSGREPVRFVSWTDLMSRSDTLDLTDDVDLSTAPARRRVVDDLASRGLDFATLRLDPDVDIEIRVVPTDVTSASTIYGQQLAALATELLARTGAHVTVTWLTHHVAS